MSREETIENTKLIAKFMESKYILDYTDDTLSSVGNLYITSWDRLMPVCKKIINMYFDRRELIFRGLLTCDIEFTYHAVVAFLKFWYDEEQLKIDWTEEAQQQLKLKWFNQNQN